MHQALENSIKILNEVGFPIDHIDEVSQRLSQEQLHLLNASKVSLLEYLSIGDIPEVKLLQDDRAFYYVFVNSLKFYQISIPENWLLFDDFSMVCKRDKKILHDKAANGLYYFCSRYQDEHQLPYKSIVRKNGYNALLFTLENPEHHLTIDETISSFAHESAVFTYAHVTLTKGPYIIRYYFNNDLAVVKTTATDNLTNYKISLNELEGIQLSNDDYQSGLDILKQLKTLHQKKIESLDLKLKPIFFFISDAETLSQCHQIIEEINALKSPIYDQRQRILQRLQDIQPDQHVTFIQQNPSAATCEHMKIEPLTIAPSKAKKISKSKSNKYIRQHIQQSMQKEMQSIVDDVNNPELSTQKIETLFQKIQRFELSTIYQFDNLTIDQRATFDSNLHKSKEQIIQHIHQLFKNNQFAELDGLYAVANEYIDGLLIGLIQKFQIQIQQVLNLSANARRDINQLLDLIMHFYSKNSFYRVYLNFLSTQYGFNHEGNYMYSIFLRIMYVLDKPDFILFLIRENLFAPTDCICVNEFYYLSLIQFLLIGMKQLHPSFVGLLEYFHSINVSIFELTNVDTFKSFIENHQPLKIRMIGMNDKSMTNSESKSIKKVCLKLAGAKPLTLIDFGSTHYFHLRESIHATLCQNIMLKNPSLAFLYLASLINKPDIYRRSMLSDGNNLAIISNNQYLNDVTAQLCPSNTQPVGMTYIFHPRAETKPPSIDNLVMAVDFLHQLQQQTYVQERHENPTWLLELYQASLLATKTTTKSNGILGVILYLIMIPNWSSDTFQKYCFYNLKRIDCLIEEAFNYHFISNELILLKDLMVQNCDTKTQSICLRFIETTLNKLIEKDSQYLTLKSQLFP